MSVGGLMIKKILPQAQSRSKYTAPAYVTLFGI
jgi:hypothetical protein